MTRLLCSAALVVTFLSTTTSCTLLRDPLANFINAKFPPVNVDQQRARSIATTAETLAIVTAPNLAFAVPTTDLETALDTEPIKVLGISKVRLRGDDGLLRIEAAFDRRFDTEPSESLTNQGLLQRLRPQVTGRIVIFAGVTSAAAPVAGDELHLELLPVFSSIAVDEVVVAKQTDVTPIGELLAKLLSRYADNVTGELARSPLMDLKVPTTFIDSVDPSSSIHVEDRGGRADITIGASPVDSPVRLLGLATLITKERVAVVGQLVPVSSPDPSPGTPVSPTFSNVKQAFQDAVDRSFQLPAIPDGPWFAIRKDLIASSLNAILKQAAVCVAASGETEQQLRNEIRFPDESSVDCSPTRNCSPTRACDFEPCRDTRNCKVCLLRNPFRGNCVQEGNDPFCEGAKAAENLRCAAEAAGKKLDCERLKEQARVACELEKGVEKGLCETGKEALGRLARTGKFGILEAGVRAKADDLRVCMKSFELSPDLSNVRLGLAIDGEAAVDVSMKFTPLDIVGHLTCQAPFTESRSFHASLRRSDVTVESTIRLTSDDGGAHATFQVQENTLPVRLQPGPTEFLLTSPNMALACQGLNLVKPLVVGLTPFVPQLRGEIDQKVKEKEVTFDVAVPEQRVGDLSVKGTVRVSPSALFLFGAVAPSPPVVAAVADRNGRVPRR